MEIAEDLKKELEIMFEAATEASFICEKLRNGLQELAVMTKSDESPVTRKRNNYIISSHIISFLFVHIYVL